MHRHGYVGRKFHRERDQRSAMIESLAEALILHGSIETTVSKAKELVPFMEKLITKAKKGDLHSRRQIIANLQTIQSAHKLVDDIAPKLKERTSGYLRIERTSSRRGDHAQMAKVSFVDDLSKAIGKSKVSLKDDAKPKIKNTEVKPKISKTTAGAKS